MDLSDAAAIRLIPFLKWRTYRFSDDLKAHVAVEELEMCRRTGRSFPDSLVQALRKALDLSVRPNKLVIDYATLLPRDFDMQGALEERLALKQTDKDSQSAKPKRIIAIIGAPRSGTSHLFNLLAYYTDWAVFTDASHHLWPEWSLSTNSQYFIRNASECILEEDSRDLKLNCGVSLPAECENIFARAIPTYKYLGGHSYEICEAKILAKNLLVDAVTRHCAYFNSETLIIKSPFNSFRIGCLISCFPDVSWNFIHIFSDPCHVAMSIERNRFKYSVSGNQLSSEDAWGFFNMKCTTVVPEGLRLLVSYDRLAASPLQVVRTIVTNNGGSLCKPVLLGGGAYHTQTKNQSVSSSLQSLYRQLKEQECEQNWI